MKNTTNSGTAIRVGVTMYPPGSPKDVGYVCNPFEWIAVTLKRGDDCWFRKNGLPWKPGVYVASMFYDGIIATVYEHDPDEYIQYKLFLDLGDRIARWEDGKDLQHWARR